MSVPLVFLHGWAMNGAVFDGVKTQLGPGFDCYAPDLPGHGSREMDEPSLAGCVEVASEIINQLDHPVLVGWSMGAAVAWQYLVQEGTQSLSGLVTIDMSPRLLPDDQWAFGLGGQNTDAVLSTSSKIEFQWRSMVNNILHNMYAPNGVQEANKDAMRALLLKQDPTALRPIWDDLIAMDARQSIAAIDIPYLVCAGAHSRLYDPEVAYWIERHSPMAEVRVFQNSGHSPHLEEPDAFCDAIRRFVRTLESSKTERRRTLTE
ncbi:alpha/beta fold hydrolase [Ruegeria arenilitoris]|uniref:alpha/beta fold hydrolase n=1 Tax=Ruegeria arenilitoris TaxID=1173585 RepID=UPI00147D93C6|nr:alpha/beta fold hydrolase [Ruegeria arenilitoris]